MPEKNCKTKVSYSRIAGLLIISMVMSQAAFAHTVVSELEKMSGKMLPYYILN